MARPKDPNYWREWRSQHPEYRERERLRSKARERTPEQRREEREKGKAKAQTEQQRAEAHRKAAREHYRRNAERLREQARERMRRSYRGVDDRKLAVNRQRKAQAVVDRLMADARRIAGRVVRPDGRSLLHDPLYEDGLAIAVERLWYLRGRPPAEREQKAEDAVRTYVRTERRHRWYASYEVDDALV